MIARAFVLTASLMFVLGCGNAIPTEDEPDCPAGTVGCACDAAGSCNAGLTCHLELCAVTAPIHVDTDSTSDPDTDSDPVDDPTCTDDPCDANATCDDSGDTPACVCNEGWEGDGHSCTDIDECTRGTYDCALGFGCENTPGAWICTDLDECALGTHNCATGFQCNNIPGHWSCADIDECATNNGNCGDPVYYACTNNVGAAPTCADIDECATNNGNCGDPVYYACTNNVGAAPSCADIDECETNNGNCGDPVYYACTNNVGAAPTCADIDECALYTHNCATDPQCENTVGGFNCLAPPIDWIDITGGSFTMGDFDQYWDLTLWTLGYHYVAYPKHQVAVPDFQMMEAEVTVAQYRDCVTAGSCTAPITAKCDDLTTCDTPDPAGCGDLLTNNYYSSENRDLHPVNCVGAAEAEQFCAWIGGRLPSESEWEYAAKNQGQDVMFPWGNNPPSCLYAVLHEDSGLGSDEDQSGVSVPALTEGCDQLHSWPVKQKPAGNTTQGLYDMIGNVSEITADCWHMSYDADYLDHMPNGNERPVDGSAWIDVGGCNEAILLGATNQRVIRGGGWHGSAARASSLQATRYRTTSRHFMNEVWHTDQKSTTYTGTTYGFRCAK